MFVPSIEDHLNALLDQQREETATGEKDGNIPSWHVGDFIRYHVWGWPPASAWLLANKVCDRSHEIAKRALDTYLRKLLCKYDRVLGELRLSVYPWDLTIPVSDRITHDRVCCQNRSRMSA